MFATDFMKTYVDYPQHQTPGSFRIWSIIMKKLLTIVFLTILLASCSPSEHKVGTTQNLDSHKNFGGDELIVLMKEKLFVIRQMRTPKVTGHMSSQKKQKNLTGKPGANRIKLPQYCSKKHQQCG